jgi:uncharacterized protein (TIGR02597 family)
MNKKFTNFLTGIAIAAGMISAAASSASVATVPTGMITYPLVQGTTNYLSLPLTNTETYTSTVNAVSSNTIAVSDTPAPFTTSLAVSGAPYFVKFLSGNEAGRVMLITSNTTSALTLDTTDHLSGTPVSLEATSFNVQSGDAFEIFPGDTLASIFGANTTQSPLILTGGQTVATSDTISLFTSVNNRPQSYFFSTTDNCWEDYGMPGNANDTIIYPYSAMAVNLRSGHAAANLIVAGRVTPVNAQTKLQSSGTVFTSTHYATDVKLSQLKFGSNWTMGSNVAVADTLAVWNPSANRFDTFYQKPDATWRRFPDDTTDQSSFAISAGTVTAIAKREAVTGGQTFLQSQLPYSLN